MAKDSRAWEVYNHQTDYQELQDSLWVLSFCFDSGRTRGELAVDEFVKAYIHGRVITRPLSLERTASEDIHTGFSEPPIWLLIGQLLSLATMFLRRCLNFHGINTPAVLRKRALEKYFLTCTIKLLTTSMVLLVE